MHSSESARLRRSLPLTPKYFQNEDGEFIYGFEQDEDGTALYECVQEAADSARDEGADYVIALSHLGIDASCTPWTSSEVIENTSGIDVFLDGHSHSVIEGETVKNKDGENVPSHLHRNQTFLSGRTYHSRRRHIQLRPYFPGEWKLIRKQRHTSMTSTQNLKVS